MTAVEWLENEMLKPNLSMKSILEQAKEMEKQQIIDAYEKHRNSKFKNPDKIDWTKSGEQYYNEKFKNK